MRIAQIAPLYESVPPRLYGGTERWERVDAPPTLWDFRGMAKLGVGLAAIASLLMGSMNLRAQERIKPTCVETQTERKCWVDHGPSTGPKISPVVPPPQALPPPQAAIPQPPAPQPSLPPDFNPHRGPGFGRNIIPPGGIYLRVGPFKIRIRP
jgi:hypothetical protein